MTASLTPLDSMIARAESLYSLPAVAMEVIQLTDSEGVDTRALKECIERDPALAAKILRVVNSSLFGLSGCVENLTQAIALLGIKPLKLLVLGFSLPDGLLDDIDVAQLHAYWRGALTRAVAARQLVESQWELAGDDAFLVALLQDIGKLVLLQQLGTPYARFLTQVRTERQSLARLEQESLGFDHRELTASLLKDWKLPSFYTESIENDPSPSNTAGSSDMKLVVPQVLHLADLLVELVDEHRLSVLPDLLEVGETYCGLNKDSLNALVAELEPQVEQLAGVLQIDLGEGEDYLTVLARAHDQLAIVAEQAAGELLAGQSTLAEEILAESQELGRALKSFTSQPTHKPDPTEGRPDAAEVATRGPRGRGATATASPAVARERLVAHVADVVVQCRTQRESLCVVRMELGQSELGQSELAGGPSSADCGEIWREVLQQMRDANGVVRKNLISVDARGCAVILPGRDRKEAAELAKHVGLDLVTKTSASDQQAPSSLKVGLAYVGNIPKSFDAERLVEAAETCLAAARTSGGDSVKSIEVY